MQADLGLSRLPLMRGHADLVENAMKLLDDIIDLRGQVAGINSHHSKKSYQTAR